MVGAYRYTPVFAAAMSTGRRTPTKTGPPDRDRPVGLSEQRETNPQGRIAIRPYKNPPHAIQIQRASACPEDERRPVVPPLFGCIYICFHQVYARATLIARCNGRTHGHQSDDSRATFGMRCREGVAADAPSSLAGQRLPTPPGRGRFYD